MDPTIIFAAIITAIGSVIAAASSALIRQPPTRISVRSMRLGIVIVGALVGFTIGIVFADDLIPCSWARIKFPAGTHTRANAAAYEVPNEVRIVWKPSRCPMVVQYYQNNQPVGKYKHVVSGSRLLIGDAGSGETEIKIWYESEGSGKLCDNRWVWVK